MTIFKTPMSFNHDRTSTPMNWGTKWVATGLGLILFIGYLPSSHSEMRVYELSVTNSKTKISRTVVSHLDDLQYPTYYPLAADETIAIQDSWMCWQRSDYFQPYCPNPKTNSTP